MSTKDQIRAIAELDGQVEPAGYICQCGCGRILRPHWEVPPYLTSRDAIMSVIVKWCGDSANRWFLFCNTMAKLYTTSGFVGIDTAFKLTPAQLCEALLRAAGEWKE